MIIVSICVAESDGEWLQCIHLAAYVLDPEYWDVDHMAMADAMDAFAQVIDKVFFHRSPPDQGWFSMLMGQLNTYKKKEGYLSREWRVIIVSICVAESDVN